MIVEKTARYLENIKKSDDRIKAFIEVWEYDAMERAKRLEIEIKNGRTPGRLYGYVIAIKDNMLYKGRCITAASKILENHISSYTATVIERLVNDDAIIIGRTNMDEFAMGSSTENSSYFPTKNPVNTDYVPGGSSGGSAAAVAADFSDVALGSDTGGSIRQPASFCGVYGLKPTYGTVSRYGLMAFSSSLDQIGPFARSIDEIRAVYDVIKGYDPKDSTTYKTIPDVQNKKSGELKIGIVDFDVDAMDKGVQSNFQKAIETISKISKTKRVKLPHLKYAISTYYIISSSEASSNLSRFDGIRYGRYVQGADINDSYEKTRGEGFGPEVKRRIILGTYSLSAGYYDAYYLKAQKARRIIKDDFIEAFKDVDVIMLPTTPTPAFKMGEKINDPLSMYLNDIFTVPVNLAGICAMNVPYGKSYDGLPYGIQFISNNFCESYLFEAAKCLL